MLDILDRFLVWKVYSFCCFDGFILMGVWQIFVDSFNNSFSKQVFFFIIYYLVSQLVILLLCVCVQKVFGDIIFIYCKYWRDVYV